MASNLVTSNPSPEPLEPRIDMVPQPGTSTALAAMEPAEEGVKWGRYVAALKRYKWLMLLVVVLGTSAGVVATRFIPPEYTARATIWVEGGPGKQGPIRAAPIINQTGWLELMRTALVFDPVVKKLGLFLTLDQPRDSAAFASFRVNEKGFRTGEYALTVDGSGRRYTLSLDGLEVESGAVADSIGRQVGLQWVPAAGSLGRARKIKFTVIPPNEASTALQQNLRTSMPEDGSFLRLSLSGTDRRTLAPTLNALSQQFLVVAADLKRAKLTELRIALDSQVTVAGRNLRDSEERLKSFQVQTMREPKADVPVPGGLASTQQTVTSSFFQQKVQLETLRQERKAIEDVLGRAQNGALMVDAFQTIPAVRGAPDLVKSLTELSGYEADLRALRYRYTDEYKGVQNDLAAIQQLKAQTIPAYARALVEQMKIAENTLQDQIDRAGNELEKIPARSIEEARLTREVGAADQLFRTLQGRHEEAKLAELSAAPDLSIVDSATTPREPSSNSAPKIIMMAVLGSFGFAVALALLLDQLDKRFRYPEQVTQELGLSILGAIPAIRKIRGGELSPDEAAQVVEAFRTIRLNLAHSYGAAGPVLLTVSSPGAGDGKSLVSSNLAVSFAEAGYNTLLMDGDIRRGELHRMFSIDRRPGLLDFLTGSAQMSEILRPTSHRGLTVIPCGTRRHQGPELLGSGAMHQLMADMKARFNVIIVDSPPLGAGIDPFVLGTATGHLMLVLRSGETDRQMAEAKLKLIDRLPIRVLGAVLNDIQAEGVYRYYSYLYGYAQDEADAAQLAGKVEVSPET